MVSLLLNWLGVGFRLLRPVTGVHAAPKSVVATLEAPSVRSRKAREPHSHPAPTAKQNTTASRRSPVPVVDPDNVNPQAALIRPYFVAHERQAALGRFLMSDLAKADAIYDRLSEAVRERLDDPELADAFEHLDDWLRAGRALPTPWKRE